MKTRQKTAKKTTNLAKAATCSAQYMLTLRAHETPDILGKMVNWILSLLRHGAGVAWVLSLSLAACDAARPELAAAVQRVASAEGAALDRALIGLLSAGPATLPFIEAALHRGAESERFNLIVALRRLALLESVPLLAHIASFDRDLRVAREAWETLMVWSAARTPLGAASRAGLQKIDSLRGEAFDALATTSGQIAVRWPLLIPTEVVSQPAASGTLASAAPASTASPLLEAPIR